MGADLNEGFDTFTPKKGREVTNDASVNIVIYKGEDEINRG